MDRKSIGGYIKNLTTYFGASLLPMVLNLVTNPWIALNMDPEDYAVSGYYGSYSSLISPIIIFYLVHYYIKEYFRRDVEERERLYATVAKATIWFSGLLSVLCFVCLLLYLTCIKTDFAFPILPYLALVVFACPLSGLMNLRLARYRMEKKANAFFVLSAANGLLGVALTFLLVVWLKLGALGKLAGPFLGALTIFCVMLWRFRGVLRTRTSLADFRKIFIFCLPLTASATLGYFTNGFSTTYLESLGQTSEYGVYIVGVSIGTYLSVFGTAIGNTFQPDLYESVIKRQWNRYVRVIATELVMLTVVVGVFILVTPFVIGILTAGRYMAATPYARIVALSTLTSNIYYLINQYSIATDRPRLYLYTSILGSVAIVCSIGWFVGRWSFAGGAWLTVVSFLFFSVINLLLLFVSSRKGQCSGK